MSRAALTFAVISMASISNPVMAAKVRDAAFFSKCIVRSGGGALDDSTEYSTAACDAENLSIPEDGEGLTADVNPYAVMRVTPTSKTLLLKIPIRYSYSRLDSGFATLQDDPRQPIGFNRVNFLFGALRRDFDGLSPLTAKLPCRRNKLFGGVIMVDCDYREVISIPINDADLSAIKSGKDPARLEPTFRGKAFGPNGESVEFKVYAEELEAAHAADQSKSIP